MDALGCDHCERDADNPWEISAHVNGTSADVIGRSAYVGALDGEPTVYRQLIQPRYQGGSYNRTRSVHQYLTHWIYPYRGKFHPQMVRALLNIVGAQPGATALDPYLGSGTTALEASLLGIHCVGVDLSPLCVLLARVKTESAHAVDRIREKTVSLLAQASLDPTDNDTAVNEDQRVVDFVKIARMVTFSDMARRKREGEPSFRKNLQSMLESVEAHAHALTRFGITPGTVSASIGDARDLRSAGIADNSLDGVVTSPPYSIALDYVKNEEHPNESTHSIRTSRTATACGACRGSAPERSRPA